MVKSLMCFTTTIHHIVYPSSNYNLAWELDYHDALHPSVGGSKWSMRDLKRFAPRPRDSQRWRSDGDLGFNTHMCVHEQQLHCI
jgi:hypothetical protein